MKPQDFLLGVRDFFAILAPGAVFLLLLQAPEHMSTSWQLETLPLFAFAIAAYLAGSLASGLGSLLDHPTDNVLRNPKFRGIFAKKLADREGFVRALSSHAFMDFRPPMPLYPETLRIFWWDHLRLNCPEAIAELNRLEGIQKLFRSLTAVFLILSVWKALNVAIFELRPLDVSLILLVMATFISLLYYAIGRGLFVSVLFRLAIAYCVRYNAPATT